MVGGVWGVSNTTSQAVLAGGVCILAGSRENDSFEFKQELYRTLSGPLVKFKFDFEIFQNHSV